MRDMMRVICGTLLAASVALMALADVEVVNVPVRAWQTTGKKTFREVFTLPFTQHAYSEKNPLDVDAAVEGHEYLGLGVAMTDSSAWVLSKLSPEKRREALERVFSAERGAGLSAMRLCIGASDYATALYTYDDVTGDVKMEHFSVARDDRYLFPVVKEAIEVNRDMFMFAVPWSPPGWMKDNGEIVNGNFKSGCGLAVANYLTAYAKACRERGIRLDALNVQNEPFLTHGIYPSCRYTMEQQSAVSKILYRRLREEGLETKVWFWDFNYNDADKVGEALADESLRKAIGGVAWHSYDHGSIGKMAELHRKFPDLPFYHTEHGPSLANPERTERWWCDRVFGAFENGCRLYSGWNLCLTDDGQPVTGPHCCAGLLTIDPESGEIEESAQYRVFRHIGPFVKRGAKVVHVDGERDGTATVMFRNPDGKYVLVIGNDRPKDAKGRPRARIYVKFRNEWLSVPLPYGTWSLTTIVFGGE